MKKIKKINFLFLAMACFLVVALCGCSEFVATLNRLNESLFGQPFVLTEYDQFGNKTMVISGDSIHVGLEKNVSNISYESTGFSSEVLELTIDGQQLYQVGNTCIIAEQGLEPVLNYDMPDEITSSSSGQFIPKDRLLNNIKNSIGKKMVIMVSSPLGIPIAVYQGDSVYVSVPDDLPKTTLLSIDGKQMYLHRTTYNIIDASLLD